jgi:hypothetical protein
MNGSRRSDTARQERRDDLGETAIEEGKAQDELIPLAEHGCGGTIRRSACSLVGIRNAITPRSVPSSDDARN